MNKTQDSSSRKVLGGVSVAVGLVVSGATFAQDIAASKAEIVDEIVVTGSRIARPDLEQASPIAVVGAEEIRLQGVTNIENVLNDLPQVVASTSGADNNPGGGVATVNLRGIGTQRTLVLVDGRRYVSYDVNQVVDLNTIPSALIERVDVVTGGRSAVYGSDAIAGVVNFITRRDFEGFELNSQYESSSRSDGGRLDVNGTIGANFDDRRGNVTLHLGYYERDALLAGERDFAARAIQDNRNGTYIFGGSSLVDQGRINIPGLGAALGTGTNNNDFGTDGSLSAFIADTDSYNFAPVNYLQIPQQRFTISAKGSYEVSDAVQPYIEAQFINNKVPNLLAPTPVRNAAPYSQGSRGVIGPIKLHVNSPFFSSATQNAFRALDAAETGALQNDGYVETPDWGFRTTSIGPRISEDERNAFRILAGAKGDIGAGWSYDGYYMRAQTKNSNRQLGNVNIERFLAATRTAFRNPTTGAVSPLPFAGVPGGGTLVCTTSAGAVVNNCVPANLFGRGNLSREAGEYLAVGATNIEEFTTQVASVAVTHGDLFDLGAGGVGVALGSEWRDESGRMIPDNILASGNIAGFGIGEPTGGSYTVTELFAEANVPLLADTFINKLEANGAARHSKYDVEGGSTFNAFTWSAGLLLEPVNGIGLRGQYQKAIRGPSIRELFLGNTVRFDGTNDPCNKPAAIPAGTLRDQCLANGVPAARLGDPTLGGPASNTPATFLGGNANLAEESASTFTVGAVLTPSFLPGFSATLDYFNIEIEDYISTAGVANILNACFNRGVNGLCAKVERDATTGELLRILDTTANTGGLKTSGLDVSIGYDLPLDFGLFDAGQSMLSFTLAGTRTLKYELTPVVGLPTVNKCAGKFGATCSSSTVVGEPLPKWRHSLRTTFTSGPITTSVQWRYIHSTVDDNPSVTYAFEEQQAMNYFDAAFSVEAIDHVRFTGGVNNIFDQEPPLSASVLVFGNGEQSNTFPNTYDVLGRYFFVGASLDF